MTLIIKQIIGFFNLLNSEGGTNQIALGLAFGVIIGFSPILSIQALLVIMICLFFRVQLGAAMLSAFFFKFIAYLADPISNEIGKAVLEKPELKPVWVTMYNLPLVPMTQFNNSIVMGSGIIALIAVAPLFFLFKTFVIKYRLHIVARFRETKIWKAWATTSVYKLYTKYNDLYNV